MSLKKMLLEEASNLKGYLIATKTWLSFKLIITGVSFFYGGIYTQYQNYGSYLELAGVAMVYHSSTVESTHHTRVTAHTLN